MLVMKREWMIVLIAVAGLPLLISAQTFTNYTTTDGLPSNTVNGVAVDNGNNVWFATDGGVAKFDGSAFTVYTASNGLIDDYSSCICVDDNNYIWVGTDIGVSKFNGINWINYTTADGLVDNEIYCMCSDNDGGVWIGTYSGLSHFTDSAFTNYTESNGLPGNMISYVYDDPDGALWIGTWLNGLVKFNGVTFTSFTTANHLLDDNILSVKVDEAGNTWVGTYMGITELDQNDQWVIDYTETDGLYKNYVHDLCFDNEGTLWVAIYVDYLQDGGITMLMDNTFTSFVTASGLVDEQVKRLAADQQDNIWIATGNGVSKLKVNNIGFDELNPVRFNVFPNPAIDVLNVDLQLPDALFQLYDMSGRLLIKECLASANNRISLSMLKPGCYTISLCNGNDVSHMPLIIK